MFEYSDLNVFTIDSSINLRFEFVNGDENKAVGIMGSSIKVGPTIADDIKNEFIHWLLLVL